MADEIAEVDATFMREALALAEHAATLGEVPVGAVIVQNGVVSTLGCHAWAGHLPEVIAKFAN